MAIQMTRAEYEKLYGVKPVFSATSTLEDEKPAPIRMTREEYNQTYYPQDVVNRPVKNVMEGKAAFPAELGGAETILPNIARTVGNIPGATVNLARNVVAPVNPLDREHPLNIEQNLYESGVALKDIYGNRGAVEGTKDIIRGVGATIGKGYDLWKKAGEAIYKNLEQNTLSEDSVAKGVGISAGEAMSKVAEAIINDPTLVPSILYAPKKITDEFGKNVTKTKGSDGSVVERNSLDEVVRVTDKDGNITYGTPDAPDAITKLATPFIKGTEKVVQKVGEKVGVSGVNNVVDEITKIEDKYATTRKANQYSKDVDASRRRIAESNVLDGSVDADGVIRTKTPGGVIDQYKAQTIDKYEDLVRKGLIESKETIPVAEVRRVLIREVGTSGLEGADLVTALKKVEKELEGLNTRIKGSSIVDLRYLHDNKIATTKNINYLTPPEKATYRKAVARAYKILVEENSKKVDVKGINERLSMYYDDIARLERLDGARAEGGRLGKYTASLAGTLIGGAAGSVGGGVGAAIGGVIGGEAAQALKGLGMSRTFKGGGKGLPKDAVLEKARLSIPDKVVKAKAGVPKTKEITEIEGKIAKNVVDQKKAIAKGDFSLVAALKEVYTALVEELKSLVKKYQEMSPREKQGGFVNFGADLPKKQSVDTSGGFEATSWSELQKQNPSLFNRGILRKSQAPMDAVGEIPKDIHTIQGKWQNLGQNSEVPAGEVFERIDSGAFKGEYIDKYGDPIRDSQGKILQDTYNESTGQWEAPYVPNEKLRDLLIETFTTPHGKKYLSEVIKALPKNKDGSITAYRVGQISDGVQSYTLSEGMAKTFSNQGTDVLPAGTPGLPSKGYSSWGNLPANIVKIDPQGIVAWSPYDAEILVEGKYVTTKSQLTDIWKKANRKDVEDGK